MIKKTMVLTCSKDLITCPLMGRRGEGGGMVVVVLEVPGGKCSPIVLCPQRIPSHSVLTKRCGRRMQPSQESEYLTYGRIRWSDF